MSKSPWSKMPELPAICLPDRSELKEGEPLDIRVDPDILPVAELAIAGDGEEPPDPVGVGVIISGRIIARLELEHVMAAAREISALRRKAKEKRPAGGRGASHFKESQ